MKGMILAVATALVHFWLVSCAGISADETAPPAPTLIPDFTWDTDPGVRIILATYCCDSPATEELVRFYNPEARLWGDGRFLWTEQDEEGARQVFVAQLATDEIQALL